MMKRFVIWGLALLILAGWFCGATASEKADIWIEHQYNEPVYITQAGGYWLYTLTNLGKIGVCSSNDLNPPILDDKAGLTTADVTHTFTAVENDSLGSYPRTLRVLVFADTLGDISGDDIVITGTNIKGDTVSETFNVTENTASNIRGSIAFSSLTTMTIPTQDGDGVVVDVAKDSGVGLPFTSDFDNVFRVWTNGDYTAVSTDSLTYDYDEIEKNIYRLPSATGTGDYHLLLWVPPLLTHSGTLKW